MNRRQAIQALVGLPSVTRIATVPASATDTDVLVFECAGKVSLAQRAQIIETAAEVFPGRRVLVLDGDVRLKAVIA